MPPHPPPELESLLPELNSLRNFLRHPPPPPPPRDLTTLATWTVSTAKPGNGIESLLDQNTTTFWQSDGSQPHTITAQFSTKVCLSAVQLYLDVEADESYTPALVSVRVGSGGADMKEIRRHRRVRNPRGWVNVPLGEVVDTLDEWSEEDTDEESDAEAVERRKARLIKRETKLRIREKNTLERWKRECEGVNGERMKQKDRNITCAFVLQIVIHCNHQNGRDSHVRMIRVLGDEGGAAGAAFTSNQFKMYQTIR